MQNVVPRLAELEQELRDLDHEFENDPTWTDSNKYKEIRREIVDDIMKERHNIERDVKMSDDFDSRHH